MHDQIFKLVVSEPDISRVPIMIDSSKWSVIEAGLKSSRANASLIQSALKRERKPLRNTPVLHMSYGAAVVVMAFDEKGQAANP